MINCLLLYMYVKKINPHGDLLNILSNQGNVYISSVLLSISISCYNYNIIMMVLCCDLLVRDSMPFYMSTFRCKIIYYMYYDVLLIPL